MAVILNNRIFKLGDIVTYIYSGDIYIIISFSHSLEDNIILITQDNLDNVFYFYPKNVYKI